MLPGTRGVGPVPDRLPPDHQLSQAQARLREVVQWSREWRGLRACPVAVVAKAMNMAKRIGVDDHMLLGVVSSGWLLSLKEGEYGF